MLYLLDTNRLVRYMPGNHAALNPRGENDLLIASHAIVLGCKLVSANEREFARIGELSYENWLR